MQILLLLLSICFLSGQLQADVPSTSWRELQAIIELTGPSARLRTRECEQLLINQPWSPSSHQPHSTSSSWLGPTTEELVSSLRQTSSFIFTASQLALMGLADIFREDLLLPDTTIFLSGDEISHMTGRLKRLNKKSDDELNPYFDQLMRIGIELSPLVTFSDAIPRDLHRQLTSFYGFLNSTCQRQASLRGIWADVCSSVAAKSAILMVSQLHGKGFYGVRPNADDLARQIDLARRAVDQARRFDRDGSKDYSYMESAVVVLVYALKLHNQLPAGSVHASAIVPIEHYYTQLLRDMRLFIRDLDSVNLPKDRFFVLSSILAQGLAEPAIADFSLIKKDLEFLVTHWQKVADDYEFKLSSLNVTRK